MRFRTEVRKFIQETRSEAKLIKAQQELTNVLVEEIRELKRERSELFDRLMAKDFEQFALGTKSVPDVEEHFESSQASNEEAMVGEVITDETFTQ